jgi:hypothetical protein
MAKQKENVVTHGLSGKIGFYEHNVDNTNFLSTLFIKGQRTILNS